MDKFNLKKYLAESKLFEEMSFDDDIENKTNKNDFAFWYRSGARGKAQALKAKDLLTKNGIDADYSKGPFYISFSNAEVEERVVQQILRDANLDRFVIMRDDKDLAEGIGDFEREVPSDGYVELMDIDDHLEDIHYEWEKWREGPMTEPEDIDPAKKDVIQYIVNYLNRSLK